MIDVFHLAAAILATLAGIAALVGCAMWIANLRREALDHRRQSAERDRQLALQRSYGNDYLKWQLARHAPPTSTVQVMRNAVVCNDVEPLSRRGADLMADEALLSDPVHAPITWRSEDLDAGRQQRRG